MTGERIRMRNLKLNLINSKYKCMCAYVFGRKGMNNKIRRKEKIK